GVTPVLTAQESPTRQRLGTAAEAALAPVYGCRSNGAPGHATICHEERWNGTGKRRAASLLAHYAGSRPFTFPALNGPGSAMSARAWSTWPQVFQRSTPRTRPSFK